MGGGGGGFAAKFAGKKAAAKKLPAMGGLGMPKVQFKEEELNMDMMAEAKGEEEMAELMPLLAAAKGLLPWRWRWPPRPGPSFFF